MFQILIKKLAYGVLVLAGVVVIVFFIFQAFGDPARMVLGQTGDKQTMDNIRKELYLDQPKWKQFIFYVNDISPLAIHSKQEIKQKGLHGFFYRNRRQ
jgi:peptide/nickel transport system permease protein